MTKDEIDHMTNLGNAGMLVARAHKAYLASGADPKNWPSFVEKSCELLKDVKVSTLEAVYR